MKRSILIVDDKIDMLQLLKRSLEPKLNCTVETAISGKQALGLLENKIFDLVLADIKMPGMDGLKLLELIKRKNPDITVLIMTGHGDIETAVKAMRIGAYDFITKPFEHDALVFRLEKALERNTLLMENIRLQKERKESDVFQKLVGKSSKMQRVYETIQMAAKTDLTVLITGESGTGKDLTARAIHTLSNRSSGPYIAVSCPTVPENILESELFGYKKGAFTHATQNKAGLFQAAHKGSIFLDEIGDITPTIQTKLLRVLQEKEIKPLGDTKSFAVDVRIIASTNRNLKKKIKNGEFRGDFFYRLNVLPIKLPPLREHREDIPLIANHLLEKNNKKLEKSVKKISGELMEIFVQRTWDGNVREMENIIMQGILFSSNNEITPKDVGFKKNTQYSGFTGLNFEGTSYKNAKEQTLMQFNSSFIGNLLIMSKGNVTQAARLCGLDRQALQQIMRRYSIKAEPFRKQV